MVLRSKSLIQLMATFLACVSASRSSAQSDRAHAFDASGRPYERYDTALAESVARQGLDFDHHYTLVKIGCGASCIMMAAVDRHNGRVVWFPHIIDDWSPSPTHQPVFYNIGSNVITVIGMLDEVGSTGPRRYLFNGRHFTPIQ